MKFIATTRNLKMLFKSALPLRKEIGCPIRFTSLNAQVNYMFPSGEVGILANFSPPFFEDFESGDEYLLVDHKLTDHLNQCFRDDANVCFWTDSDSKKAYIQGEESGDRFDCPLAPVEEIMKVPPFHPIKTEAGLMPTYGGKEGFNVQAKLPVKQLVKGSQGKSDKAALNWDKGMLELSVSMGPDLTTTNLDPTLFLSQGEPIAVIFNRDNFRELVKQFIGEVWLGIVKGAVVISQAEYRRAGSGEQIGYGYRLTYLLIAENLDDEYEHR